MNHSDKCTEGSIYCNTPKILSHQTPESVKEKTGFLILANLTHCFDVRDGHQSFLW